MSDKIYKINDERNKLNHGFILDDLKPVTQIVQIRGNEKIIKENEWGKLFVTEPKREILKNESAKETLKVRREKAMSIVNLKLDNLDVNDELIKLNEEEMNELLNEFEPIYEIFTKIVSNLLNSPYEEDLLKIGISKANIKTKTQ